MMKLTTEAKYAVLALLDMALYSDEGHTTLAEIAARQGIPLRFLEQIFHKLKKAGIVHARRGPGGGYAFSRATSQITVGDVIEAIEGPISLSGCHVASEQSLRSCAISDRCLTDFLWAELGKMISNFFDSITIEDLCEKRKRIKAPLAGDSSKGGVECA